MSPGYRLLPSLSPSIIATARNRAPSRPAKSECAHEDRAEPQKKTVAVQFGDRATVLREKCFPVALTMTYREFADTGVRIDELSLTQSDDDAYSTLTDYNADGSWDYRRSRDFQRQLTQHWAYYQGDWQELRLRATADENHRLLVDGTEVEFDVERGVWVAVNREQ